MKILSSAACGSTVVIGGRSFIVLEQLADSTALITKEFATTMEFGKSGDWRESGVRKYCNEEFYQSMCDAVGRESIVMHDLDLMADDGTGENVHSLENISILTAPLYRKYRKYLSPYGRYWWLATRVTHENKDYAHYVCCVDSDGILNWGGCDCRCGVRPFCFLNSSIFVDEE